MTTYASSSVTLNASVRGENESEKDSWLLPALVIGGGIAGAAIIYAVSKKGEKK
jgi:hypothetical protein